MKSEKEFMDAGVRVGRGQTFVPDYTVRAITDVVYFRISRPLYQVAHNASLFEKVKQQQDAPAHKSIAIYDSTLTDVTTVVDHQAKIPYQLQNMEQHNLFSEHSMLPSSICAASNLSYSSSDEGEQKEEDDNARLHHPSKEASFSCFVTVRPPVVEPKVQDIPHQETYLAQQLKTSDDRTITIL